MIHIYSYMNTHGVFIHKLSLSLSHTHISTLKLHTWTRANIYTQTDTQKHTFVRVHSLFLSLTAFIFALKNRTARH